MKTKTDKIVEHSKSFLWALFVVLLFRAFLYQLFNIPSGSMYPTCMEGDFLIVNKWAYGFSTYSLPLQIQFSDKNERILFTPPKRGDVIVFHNPFHIDPASGKNEGVEYVKRLVGLPGDRIQVKNGTLHINGKAVKREYLGSYEYTDTSGRYYLLKKYKETFPEGHEHVILQDPLQKDSWQNNTKEYVVPEGHYFGMGDNRDNSMDCRWEKEIGYIPQKRLVGRAEIFIFSINAKLFEVWKWPFNIRFDRIMKPVNMLHEK